MIRLQVINSMSIAIFINDRWVGTILNDRNHVISYLQKHKGNTE